MNIPEGFVLVPVEPTGEMVEEVQDLGRIDPDDVEAIWSGMLAASPAPKKPIYDEAKERALFEGSFSSFPEGIWFSQHKGLYLSVNGRIYEQGQANDMNNQFAGWKACAQSRDGSAE